MEISLDKLVWYIEEYTEHKWNMRGSKQDFINNHIKEARENEQSLEEIKTEGTQSS